MNEKDLLEQLKQSAENIEPPKSLHPENIEKALQAAQESTADCHSSKQATKKTKTAKRKFPVYRMGGLAAAFTVAIIGSWTAGRYSVSQDIRSNDRTAALQTPKAESGTGTGIMESNPEADGQIQSASETEILSDLADTSRALTEADQEARGSAASLTTADSYESLYDTLFEKFGSPSSYARDTVYDGISTMDIAVEEEMDTGMLSSNSISSAAGQTSGTAYSQTNVQEAGVDEADIVKTDGNYIYVLKRDGSLVILSAKEGSLETAASLQLPQGETTQEMYVDGDRLSVITSEYYTEMDSSDENVIATRSGNRTKLYTYDITDRSKPFLAGTVTQDGVYAQSRKNGAYLYLFTQFSPILLDTYDESFLVPATSSGRVEASDIYLPDYLNYSTYLVVSSINIDSPNETIDQKAVVSGASTFYASTENIYIANENWNGADSRTELLKLHYENGAITGAAAGSLEGYLNNSFSLNEYNGYLRAVTTSYGENYQERNGLYILDENLQPIGSIRDLAPDETVRSARFLGNTAYFVTFRQTDPLFSVDLSDPANPEILGDLKVTGFSSYLHFYKENLLLGLGYEADPETGIQTGLKLSMFDISDPANVTEVSKLVLNGITWCDALNNYKSILIDPEKNIFGFTCDNRYLVFSYDEERGFVKEFLYDFYNDMLNGYDSSSSNDTRGLYIDNTLYLVRPDVVNAFDMENNYQQIGQLPVE